MIAVLPAAGAATRMRGIPKFAIPAFPDGLTLLEKHVEMLLPLAERVVIPTRPENVTLVYDLVGKDADIFAVRTLTMAETVLEVHGIFRQKTYLLGMPDTLFEHANPYKTLADNYVSGLSLGLFDVKEQQMGSVGQVKMDNGVVSDHKDKDPLCKFPFVWGAMVFDSEYLRLVRGEDAHIGIAISRAIGQMTVLGHRFDGRYFDLGTPYGFVEAISHSMSSPL